MRVVGKSVGKEQEQKEQLLKNPGENYYCAFWDRLYKQLICEKISGLFDEPLQKSLRVDMRVVGKSVGKEQALVRNKNKRNSCLKTPEKTITVRFGTAFTSNLSVRRLADCLTSLYKRVSGLT
jgi:hypothetical protein